MTNYWLINMHYWVICSCIHKLFSRIFIYSNDDLEYFCIQWRWLEYFIFNICILRWRPWRWPVPLAYKVVSRAHCIQLIKVILAYVLGDYVHWRIWWFVNLVKMVNMWWCECVLVAMLYLYTCWSIWRRWIDFWKYFGVNKFLVS